MAHGSPVQGRTPVGIRGGAVRTALEQDVSGRGLPLPGGKMQRREALLVVTRVGVTTVFQVKGDILHIAARGRFPDVGMRR